MTGETPGVYGGYVVDASVGIKLFVDEPLSEQAHALFGGLVADLTGVLHVPDLFYIECANVLLKYQRRFGMPLADAQQNLADLCRLALVVTTTAELSEEVLLLAARHNLSAYDACYLALAQRLGLPLVTADRALAQATGTVWLGDWSLE